MITENVTAQTLISVAAQRLLALRNALIGVQEFQTYLAGIANADLEAAPLSLSAAYVAALKSAFADADALRQLYQAGSLPGTYTLPYVFQSSQAPVIGPQ